MGVSCVSGVKRTQVDNGGFGQRRRARDPGLRWTKAGLLSETSLKTLHAYSPSRHVAGPVGSRQVQVYFPLLQCCISILLRNESPHNGSTSIYKEALGFGDLQDDPPTSTDS